VKVEYSIFVPSGNRMVSMAAHHFLSYGPLRTLHATIHPGIPNDALVVLAEESPEMDSHIKQLGVLVAEVANLPVVTVAKKTGKNIHTWDMQNVNYVPPQPVQPGVATTPPAPVQPPAGSPPLGPPYSPYS
jgi:hypothetical protein